jgi:hypothetical protein
MPQGGTFSLRTVCSDTSDTGLHDQSATLLVDRASHEPNPLFRHGPIRVSDDHRHFVHHDGKPFCWLGDTWWMVMSDRIAFPDDFAILVDHRAALGFNVIQTVVGFPGDITPFQGVENNEGGPPWEPGYTRINPAYFDAVDRRLTIILSRGMVPCILGSWGYHLHFMTEPKMALHWKYLVARYGAWPVVFCLAGEGAMQFYTSGPEGAQATERQKEAWSRIGTMVKQIDPYQRPLTMHPRRSSWDDMTDSGMLDFNMLQPGHMPNALQVGTEWIDKARAEHGEKPVVNAEPPYEGHAGTNGPDVQRYAFWTSVCCGAAGYTYGCAGVFLAHDRVRPVAMRPDGGIFDRWTWDEGMRFPGAVQIGRGKALLESLPFNRLEPHPEWVQTPLRWGQDAYHPPMRTFCAAIPRELRLIYVPRRWYHWEGPIVTHLEPGVRYRVTYYDPSTLDEIDAGIATGDEQGRWQGPITPYMHDWLVVMRAA